MQLIFGYDSVWKCLGKNKKTDEKQLKFCTDRFWNCLRKIPMRCDWVLAETKFGIVLEEIRWDAIELLLWISLEMSWKK